MSELGSSERDKRGCNPGHKVLLASLHPLGTCTGGRSSNSNFPQVGSPAVVGLRNRNLSACDRLRLGFGDGIMFSIFWRTCLDILLFGHVSG